MSLTLITLGDRVSKLEVLLGQLAQWTNFHPENQHNDGERKLSGRVRQIAKKSTGGVAKKRKTEPHPQEPPPPSEEQDWNNVELDISKTFKTAIQEEWMENEEVEEAVLIKTEISSDLEDLEGAGDAFNAEQFVNWEWMNDANSPGSTPPPPDSSDEYSEVPKKKKRKYSPRVRTTPRKRRPNGVNEYTDEQRARRRWRRWEPLILPSEIPVGVLPLVKIEKMSHKALEGMGVAIPQRPAPLGRFFCEYCGKNFTRYIDLTQHRQKIHGDVEGFLAIPAISRHKPRVYPKATNPRVQVSAAITGIGLHCPFCQKLFARRITLEEHIRLHTGEKPFLCSMCAYRTTRRSCLNNHMILKHTGEQSTTETKSVSKYKKYSFPCAHCQRPFSKRVDREEHVKAIHTGERPFICSTCGYGAVSLYRLQQHQRAHKEGQSPCGECGRKLKKRKDYERHMIIYHSENSMKKFPCANCSRSFPDAETLQQHTLKVHTKGNEEYEKRIKCDHCDKRFPSEWRLRKHLERLKNPHWLERMPEITRKFREQNNYQENSSCSNEVTASTSQQTNNQKVEVESTEVSIEALMDLESAPMQSSKVERPTKPD